MVLQLWVRFVNIRHSPQVAHACIEVIIAGFKSAPAPELLSLLSKSGFFTRIASKSDYLLAHRGGLAKHPAGALKVYLKLLLQTMKETLEPRKELASLSENLAYLQYRESFTELFG